MLCMKVIPAAIATPRLLSSAALAHENATSGPAANRSRLKGSSLFCGNAIYIFGGIFLGSVLLTLGGFSVYSHRKAESPVVSKSLPEQPHAPRPEIAALPVDSPVASAPNTVQVDPKLLRISAIALGRPRLAVINGRPLAEKDALTVKVGSASVTLHVVRIDEGAVDLTDGSREFTVRMAPEALTHIGKR